MDYLDFVDAMFHDQPSVLALRFSLVVPGNAPNEESSILWFVRDDDRALCLVGSVAPGFRGYPDRLARTIATTHAASGLRLPGEQSALAESRSIVVCAPDRADHLRGCFVPDGPYLVAMDLEQGLGDLPDDLEDGAQSEIAGVAIAGLSLGGTFEQSVWLAAFSAGPEALDPERLYRDLVTCYPIRLNCTPFHRWSHEFGDQYWSGLPRLRGRFLGTLAKGSSRSGDPSRNIFWSKNRNSPLPAWREVCKLGTHDLVDEVRHRLSELDARVAGRLGPGPLIRWLEAKGRNAAVSEVDCAAVLCACGTLARTDQLWLPLLCLIWRPQRLERATDPGQALSDLLGPDARDPWRKYARVGHAGYAIGAIIALRELLSGGVGGLVSDSIRYRPPDGALIQTIEISGIDATIAETLVSDVDAGPVKDEGVHRHNSSRRESRTAVSRDLARALGDLKDDRRGGIGEIATEHLPAQALLRIVILIRTGLVR